MPKKKKKDYSRIAIVSVVTVLVIGMTVLGMNVVSAQLGFREAVIERLSSKLADIFLTEEVEPELGLAFCMGDSATTSVCRFTFEETTLFEENVLFSGNVELGTAFADVITTAGDVRLNSTTTYQEMKPGSRYYEALSQTAGSTTTPGGMASIPNVSGPKNCGKVILDIVTAPPIDYECSVATSTSATAWSALTSPGLIATSTQATSAAALLSSVYGGQGAGDVDGVWQWGLDVFLNVACDATADVSTSTSADWTSIVGGVYVDCITR